MQRESFQYDAVAKLLNDNAIAIKVDRELRPALDAHLIDFVEKTTGGAGWRLDVLLTPDGYPLLGFTHLSKQRGSAVLERLFARWRSEPAALALLAKQADGRLRELRRERPLAGLHGAQLQKVEARLLSQIMQATDTIESGFGAQAKFPSVPQLRSFTSRCARRLSTNVDDREITGWYFAAGSDAWRGVGTHAVFALVAGTDGKTMILGLWRVILLSLAGSAIST